MTTEQPVEHQQQTQHKEHEIKPATAHHQQHNHTQNAEQESQDVDISAVIRRIKQLPPWTAVALALIAIVLLGGYLRFYHIDYPMVGYHNWKEAHYSTEARNFARDGFFKWGFFMPYFDIHQGADGDDGQHPDSFPLASIIIGILFKFFGPSLFLARLPSVLFSCGTIVALFFLVRKMFNRNDLALTASALFAIMPLTIFFGRQVQLEPYAHFFMVLAGYYYLRWLDVYETKWMWYTSITFVMGFLARYDHFTIGFAFLFVFPWSKVRDKAFMLKTAIPALVPFIPVLLWKQYMQWYGYTTNQPSIPLPILEISTFFKPEWSMAVQSYIRDNFTFLGLKVACVGIAIVLLFLISNRRHIGYRFLFGYIIGALIWIPVAVNYLEGHAYHQYPVTSLIAILQALVLVTIGTTIAKLTRMSLIKPVFIIVCIYLLYVGFGASEGLRTATNRVWDTQFPGLDIAGDYIRTHSASREERIMHTSGQGYGLMWHADRRGHKLPTKPSDLNKLEDKGAKWIFIYQWGFNKFQDQEFVNYLSGNYSLRQMAFVNSQQGNQPLFFLFEKGGTSNMSSINEWIQGKQVSTRYYEYSSGAKFPVAYTV